MEADAILSELVSAIGAQWDGETPRRRSNAIGPRTERALAEAKRYLKQNNIKLPKNRQEQLEDEVKKLRDEIEGMYRDMAGESI